jgi:hypothetical protein
VKHSSSSSDKSGFSKSDLEDIVDVSNIGLMMKGEDAGFGYSRGKI